MTRTFIFDLDGVIVDTAKYHFVAWQNLAKGLGINFTEAENEQLKGVSRIESLKKILHWGNKTVSDEVFQSLMDKKNEEYLSFINKMNEDEILPGVLPVLNFLKDNGLPIALGSASKNARVILEKTNLLRYFDAIVDGNEVAKAKPDPEVFSKAAQLTQSENKNCVVFEDSVAGVQAANLAGMVSVGIGDKNVLFEATHNFASFDELSIEFIKQLMKEK